MKCPYCGSEMKIGYIQARDGVYWSEKERLVAALPLGGGKMICLTNNSNEVFHSSSTEAYLCVKCKKILIDYSNIE